MAAWRKLKYELDKGWLSGEESGWIASGDVRARLEARQSG